MTDHKLVLTLSALLSSSLVLCGCSRVGASNTVDEAARRGATAQGSAAPPPGDVETTRGDDQPSVADLVAANQALEQRVRELEARATVRRDALPSAARHSNAALNPPEVVEGSASVRHDAVAADSSSRSPLGSEAPPDATPRDLAVEPPLEDEVATAALPTVPAGAERSAAWEGADPEEDLTLAAGTPIRVEVLDRLSTVSSRPGDRFRGRLAADVLADGRVAIAGGAAVTGHVVDVRSSRRVGGRPALTLAFDSISLPGGASARIDASWSVSGASQTRNDAATIAGATVGGAILGRIFDKGDGGVVGGLLGAAAGTAAARQRVGRPLVLDRGDVVSTALDAATVLRVRN